MYVRRWVSSPLLVESRAGEGEKRGEERKRKEEEKEVHSSGEKPSVRCQSCAYTASSLSFLHSLPFYFSILPSLTLVCSSYPFFAAPPCTLDALVPGTRTSRTTYAVTPLLQQSRASSSAPPFTPRCPLENPTLFGSFDQSSPAN